MGRLPRTGWARGYLRASFLPSPGRGREPRKISVARPVESCKLASSWRPGIRKAAISRAFLDGGGGNRTRARLEVQLLLRDGEVRALAQPSGDVRELGRGSLERLDQVCVGALTGLLDVEHRDLDLSEVLLVQLLQPPLWLHPRRRRGRGSHAPTVVGADRRNCADFVLKPKLWRRRESNPRKISTGECQL